MALAAAVAAVVLTISLRPLRRIVATADAITAGSLSERAPAAPRRSEIGRVATALNRMLGQIQTAFAQRDATEDRLRRFLADASHELRTPLTSSAATRSCSDAAPIAAPRTSPGRCARSRTRPPA
jgi:two-component system OmpR family sensor kinase